MGVIRMFVDILVIAIIAVMLTAAVRYIQKEKKRGVTCIGCPHAVECAKKKQGGCHTDR